MSSSSLSPAGVVQAKARKVAKKGQRESSLAPARMLDYSTIEPEPAETLIYPG